MNIIDIHCHPSLKIDLWGYNIYSDPPNPAGDLPFFMSVNLNTLKEGEVNGVVATHYLPEYGLIKYTDSSILKEIFLKLITIPDHELLKKFEDYKIDGNYPFIQTKKIMDLFENQIKTAREEHGWKVIIAKSFTEVKEAIQLEKTYFIHAIEGAHSLGRGLNVDNYKKNIKELFDNYGLAQLTLAHFFENDVTFTQGALPASYIKKLKIDYNYDSSKGLNTHGEELVKYMLELGIIIDLTHCTPIARQQVYDLNNKKRPLIFSHTGVREIAKSKMNPNDLNELPDDKEIRKIADCKGVIGLLWMNYWLTGKNTPLNGIKNIQATINHIAELCKQDYPGHEYDFISIGTDLDGFTTVPLRLESEAKMKDLYKALASDGLSKENLAKIFGGNYMRVLELGWGEK